MNTIEFWTGFLIGVIVANLVLIAFNQWQDWQDGKAARTLQAMDSDVVDLSGDDCTPAKIANTH